MPEENGHNPQVTSTIIKPEEIGVPQKAQPRKRTQKKRKAAQRIKVTTNNDPPRWLSAISNFLLLIAVFTIIFAAHKALNRKQTTVSSERPAVSEEKTRNEETKDEGRWTMDEKKDDSEQIQITDQEEEKTKDEKPEPTQMRKRVNAKTRKHIDPYTSGGPLDLDRRNSHANGDFRTDLKDPWNSGGEKDLDSEAARLEYKKSYLSVSDSAKEPSDAKEPSK